MGDMASHVGCVVALPVIRHVRSRVKTGPDSFETRLPIFPQTTDITRQSGYFRKVPKPEVGSLHSITSSARARSEGGTVRPSTLAVFRLITSS